MNYELALKLKEAGFYQKYGEGLRFIYPDGTREMVVSDEENQVKNGCYIPSLEELIEACGTRFCGLFAPTRIASYWRAIDPNEDAYGHGTNAFEAVANLWLELRPMRCGCGILRKDHGSGASGKCDQQQSIYGAPGAAGSAGLDGIVIP